MGKVSSKGGVFQGDSLSRLFVLCLLPLRYILRYAAPGYHFGSNGEKVNHLLFMDDLKSFASDLNH